MLWEAFGNYLGFQVFHAGQSSPGTYTPVRPFAHEESSLPDAELVAP